MKKKHRVYCTYFPDGRYYIGMSSKSDKDYEKYYGSSTTVKDWEWDLKKETIATFEKKSHAKMQEFLLQWQCHDDLRCVNGIYNIRLSKKHLASFTPLSWQPKDFQQLT